MGITPREGRGEEKNRREKFIIIYKKEIILIDYKDYADVR